MKFFNKFIPKWLKAIDKKLLLNYPQIWVTKLHYAVFFTLIINLILFTGTYLLYNYNVMDSRPQFETPLALMILPAVVFFVWWFVVQSWYNVDKNFGKMSLKQDYGNYFIYWIIALVFYSTVAVIPHTMNLKVKNELNQYNLLEDQKSASRYLCYYDKYNLGNELVTFENGNFKFERTFYEFTPKNLDGSYYYYGHNAQNEKKESLILSESEIRKELQHYYNLCEQYLPPHEQPKKNIDGAIDDIRNMGVIGNNYNSGRLDNELRSLLHVKYGNGGFPFWDEVYLKVIFAITGFLALLVWVFKNVHWKNFVGSAVVQIISPFIIGIFGLIIYEIFRLRGGADETAVLIIIISFIILSLVLIILPWLNQKHSSSGVISAITFQVWLPFLPLILYAMMDEINNYSDNSSVYRSMYYIGMALTLLCLPAFKIYYKRMWALPKGK